MRDTLIIGDQQRLADGQSVIIGRGLRPFVAYTRATYEQLSLRHRIGQEPATVNWTSPSPGRRSSSPDA